MNRNEALATLDQWVPDPRGGLPEDLFVFFSRMVPVINVDLWIREERGVLLTWRDDEYYGAGWHVPGGIIRYKDTLAERIAETAARELGLRVEHDPHPAAVLEWIEPERRERGHFISLLYRCRALDPPAEALRWPGGTPRAGQWAWHRECPDNLIAAQSAYRGLL